MYTLHCTKKLLDRVKVAPAAASPPPTTALGNWYATALFWKPQVALLVNERTLLPVLMPLAPAATLTSRFRHELAAVLRAHDASQAFVDSELGAMSAVTVAKTSNRSVVGTMNEFSFLAEAYRGDMETVNSVAMSMHLAGTPCGALKYDYPTRLVRELLGANAQ